MFLQPLLHGMSVVGVISLNRHGKFSDFSSFIWKFPLASYKLFLVETLCKIWFKFQVTEVTGQYTTILAVKNNITPSGCSFIPGGLESFASINYDHLLHPLRPSPSSMHDNDLSGCWSIHIVLGGGGSGFTSFILWPRVETLLEML